MGSMGAFAAERTSAGRAGSPSLITVTGLPSRQPWSSNAARSSAWGCSATLRTRAKRRLDRPSCSTLPQITSKFRTW
jgi:hypothetical protein